MSQTPLQAGTEPRTRLPMILVYHKHMLVPSIRRPARDAPHLKALPLLPPDELRAGEHARELVAEFVRRLMRLRSGGDEDLGRDVWVGVGEEGCEGVVGDVGVCLLAVLAGRGGGIGGKEGGVKLALVIEGLRYVLL